MTTTEVSYGDVLWAARSVSCPKCKAKPGSACMSTGGGNPAEVATHKARRNRVQDWADEFAAQAGQLAKSVAYKRWDDWAPSLFDQYEAVATAIPVKGAKPLTPKGVQLSEKQAEEIERYVMSSGRGYISTAHFSGDHQDRQTANALEAKGIIRFVEMTADHYDRRMELTPFGWQVYRQHRLIIRRLDEPEVDALEAKAGVR
jgi:hypothetical protein